MQQDHWLNPEHFSTANLEYRTSKSSWNQGFRGELIQNRSEESPVKPSLFQGACRCAAHGTSRPKETGGAALFWKVIKRLHSCSFLVLSLSSHGSWGGGRDCAAGLQTGSVTCNCSSINRLSRQELPTAPLGSHSVHAAHGAHWRCWNSWRSHTPNILQKRHRSGRHCSNSQCC